MGARVHWELCKKYSVEVVDKWYEHKPQLTSRSEDGNVIITLGYTIDHPATREDQVLPP